MKKRLIGLLVCVMLIMTAFTGLAVHADEETAFIVIGGVRVEETNADVFGDGTAAYDAEAGTLTLSGFNYAGEGADVDGKSAAIYVSADIELILDGENSAELVKESADDAYGLYAAGSLTVSGEGSFTAKACDALTEDGHSTGIFCGGAINVASCDVEAYAGKATVRSCGINTFDLLLEGGSITGVAAEVTGESESDRRFSLGVRTEGTLAVTGGALTGIAGDAEESGVNSYGIHPTERGTVTVTGGNVIGEGGAIVNGSSSGIRVASTCGDATFTGGKLEFTGDTYGYDGDYGPHLSESAEVIAIGGYQGFSTSMSLRHPTPYFEGGHVDITAGATAESAATVEDVSSYEYEDEYVHIKMARFIDVDPGAWYAKAVYFCADNSYMSGTGEYIFSPNATMTRAMFVQMLAKMDGADLASYAGLSTFGDVPAGKWYSAAVEWANDKGITGGVGEGNFLPDGEVSREQIAVFLKAYAAYKGYGTEAEADIEGYTDAGEVHSWAVPALRWALGCNIISGTSTTTLSPLMTATRCQVAQMAMKFCMNFGA